MKTALDPRGELARRRFRHDDQVRLELSLRVEDRGRRVRRVPDERAPAHVAEMPLAELFEEAARDLRGVLLVCPARFLRAVDGAVEAVGLLGNDVQQHHLALVYLGDAACEVDHRVGLFGQTDRREQLGESSERFHGLLSAARGPTRRAR